MAISVSPIFLLRTTMLWTFCSLIGAQMQRRCHFAPSTIAPFPVPHFSVNPFPLPTSKPLCLGSMSWLQLSDQALASMTCFGTSHLDFNLGNSSRMGLLSLASSFRLEIMDNSPTLSITPPVGPVLPTVAPSWLLADQTASSKRQEGLQPSQWHMLSSGARPGMWYNLKWF